MEQEIWKDIPKYEGYYQVSNYGNVKSLRRSIPRKNGKILNLKEKLLSQKVDEHGYYKTQLWKDNKPWSIRIHRLVAICFLSKNGYNEVNHKDGNKLNNYFLNLEWCNSEHNHNEAIRLGLKITRKVKATKNCILIGVFSSISQASFHTKTDKSLIYRCLNGTYKQVNGIVWEYA